MMKEKTIIEINLGDNLYESKTLSHIAAGLVGYLLGKNVALKVRGDEERVTKFIKSLEELKSTLNQDYDIEKIRQKYRLMGIYI